MFLFSEIVICLIVLEPQRKSIRFSLSLEASNSAPLLQLSHLRAYPIVKDKSTTNCGGVHVLLLKFYSSLNI